MAAPGSICFRMLQDYCRRLGVGGTETELRHLAASLKALPPDHPLAPLLRNSPDFADRAGLADALLHPLDRSYSVPELLDFLDRAGLSFGRWVRQAPYLPWCGALASTPHQPRLIGLTAGAQYAAIELFRGTMVRHGVVAYRKDRPAQGAPVDFEGEAWLGYAPIRLPDTLAVRDRLPPGAAAVLINRNQHIPTSISRSTRGRSGCWPPSTGNAPLQRFAASRPTGASPALSSSFGGGTRSCSILRENRIC